MKAGTVITEPFSLPPLGQERPFISLERSLLPHRRLYMKQLIMPFLC